MKSRGAVTFHIFNSWIRSAITEARFDNGLAAKPLSKIIKMYFLKFTKFYFKGHRGLFFLKMTLILETRIVELTAKLSSFFRRLVLSFFQDAGVRYGHHSGGGQTPDGLME